MNSDAIPNDLLREKIARLGGEPGVYLWKDARGAVLYVGKAKSLKKRVSSYFARVGRHDPKTEILVSQIADLDFIVCETEMEAFMLESNLIKKLLPRFNINLKDNKSYPYLKLTLNEKFPRLIFTRKIVNDGGKYYGPYSSAHDLRDTLRFLQKVFPLRLCERLKAKPCLYYFIKKCDAPCVHQEAAAEYDDHVESVKQFLEGKQMRVVGRLKEDMKKSSSEMKFEKAALLRDRLKAIETLFDRQRVVMEDGGERDVLAVHRAGNEACVQVMIIREGRLKDQEAFYMDVSEEDSPSAILTQFIRLYYSQMVYVPGEMLVAEPVEEKELVVALLEERRGKKVQLMQPQRGKKRELADMARDNARHKMERRRIFEKMPDILKEQALEDLQEMLELPNPIFRMAGMDISTIQGTNTVGSAVMFKDGKPAKDEYKQFRIRGSGADDFSSMREMALRYFKRVRSGDFPRPDLVIIDGGPGQLSMAREAMMEAGVMESFGLISFAKESQSIYRAEGGEPIPLLENSEISRLIKRLMMEAHRFAITYHRTKRGKEMLKS